MGKPLKFILNTDYATLKNDSPTTTIQVSIPATTIGAGASQVYSNVATVGTSGAPLEYDINYSLSTRRWKCTRLQFVENTGTGTQYQGWIIVFRSSPTQAMVYVLIFNGNASSVTKTARTITVRVRSFLPPFS